MRLARPLVLYPLVAVAGAVTMVVELAAVRLLAPWYGASSGVWTNVIGVILAALALGYLVGARLACGARPARWLARALLASAAVTAWLPSLAAPVARAFLPAGLDLDEAAGLLLWGSLASSTLLFGPAAVVLGAIGPLAVELAQRERGGHAGDAGGRVLAASTLGSLAGTFATTHLLLPDLGLSWTFLAAAIALGILGALAVTSARAEAVSALLALVAVGGLVGSRSAPPEIPPDTRLLAAVESPYQSLRVVERAEDDGTRTRLLLVNEGFDSFQSVWRAEPGWLPVAYYYNLFALPPWWARARGTWRALVLGSGAGTAGRVLSAALPSGVELELLEVELDPRVVALGREYFELESGPGRRIAAGVDARAALATLAGPFDEIVLDAYANNMEVPAHLSTLEFFREVRARLAGGGWLVVNAAGFGLDDPVVEALARTVAAAFRARILVARVPFSRNCVLFARADAPLPEPGGEDWLPADAGGSAVAARLALPGAWRFVEPGGAVLLDDRNPIERLQRSSIGEGRAAWVQRP